jgi:hypothetical protein
MVAVVARNGDKLASGAEGGVADYHSIIDKAVSALDLNTEQARRRLYERARAALHSEMHSVYPPFRRSQIAAEEMSLEMAIEAVEAEAVRKQNAKLELAGSSLRANVSVNPGPPVRQNGRVRHSLATLWAGFRRRADDGAPGRDANPDHGTDSKGHTWLTELLDSASRGLDNEGQDFTPRWMPAKNGNTKRQR